MVLGRTFRLRGSGKYLTSQKGQELMEAGEDVEVVWRKMSKSKHNGVDPMEVIHEFGADTIRLFLLAKVMMS